MIETLYDLFDVPVLFQQVLVAIAIGGLIGLEREKEPGKYAGLRTLALLCGSAPVIVHIAELSELPWLVGLYVGVAIAIALSIATIRFVLTGKEVGFTTSVTVILVALLGLLVGYGRFFEATSIAIITAFLLAEKEQLVGHVDNLTYQELTDSMKLGALVFILYPILPTEAIDPYGVIRLREVLLFAIFVLLIEFSAYVSMKQFGGSKGLQVTGILAGMANSFATAAVMARMANQSRDALDAASSGLLLSVMSMIVRNVGLASIIAFSIFWVVWKPAIVMLGVTFIISYILLLRSEHFDSFDIDMDSPFSFKAAAKFSAIYVAITVVSILSQQLFGDTGLYVTAFLGGLVSSAAVAVSAGSILNQGAVSIEAAGGMVMLGIMASLTSKCVLVELINGQMRSRGILPMALVGVTGIVVYFVV